MTGLVRHSLKRHKRAKGLEFWAWEHIDKEKEMQKFQSVGFPVMTSHQSASHGQWAVIVIRFYFVCATLAPDDRKAVREQNCSCI